MNDKAVKQGLVPSTIADRATAAVVATLAAVIRNETGPVAADSGGSRPRIRDDVARFDVARESA